MGYVCRIHGDSDDVAKYTPFMSCLIVTIIINFKKRVETAKYVWEAQRNIVKNEIFLRQYTIYGTKRKLTS